MEIVQVGDPNSGVHAFFDHVHDSVQEQQVRADVRMMLKKIAQDQADISAAERYRGGDRELAPQIGTEGDRFSSGSCMAERMA